MEKVYKYFKGCMLMNLRLLNELFLPFVFTTSKTVTSSSAFKTFFSFIHFTSKEFRSESVRRKQHAQSIPYENYHFDNLC